MNSRFGLKKMKNVQAMRAFASRAFASRAFASRAFASRVMVVLILAAATNACDGTPAENIISDVTVALTVSQPAFHRIDGTTVRVTVTNQGLETVIIPCPRQALFEVMQGGKTIIDAGGRPCIAMTPAQFIRPGESFTNELVWHGSDWNLAVELRDGRYALRGKVYVDEQLVYSDAVPVQILSN